VPKRADIAAKCGKTSSSEEVARNRCKSEQTSLLGRRLASLLIALHTREVAGSNRPRPSTGTPAIRGGFVVVRGGRHRHTTSHAPPTRACNSSQASVGSAQAEMLALARARRGRRRVLATRKQHTQLPRVEAALSGAPPPAGRLRRQDPGSCFVDRSRPSHGTGVRGRPAREHDTVMGIERKLGVGFIGTFFLVLTVGMAVATAGTLAPPAIGAVLMVTAAGLRWPRGVAEPRRSDPARSAFSPGASRKSMIRQSLHERHLLTRARGGAVVLILREIGGPHGPVVRCR
jgi:hypothetical protein